MRDMPQDTTPLFVRLPRREADLLDRVAFEGRISKRELVTSLVQRYLGEDEPKLTLGRRDLRPAEAPDVLTLEQAAALLQVDAAEVAALAEAGELPGRRIGGDWRFPRARSWSGWPPAKCVIAHVPHHRLHRRRHAARRRARRPPDLHEPRPHRRGGRRGAARRRPDLRGRLPRRAHGAAGVGRRARADPRPRDRPGRAARRGQQGGAVAARHPGGRQALRRVARRGAGDHRHLRLLHRRGPAAVRPDRPVGDARQAALHLPRPGRRRRDHHRRQLPGRGALLVPRPGDPVRQRRRLEAGRVLARARGRARAAVPRRRRPRRRAQPRPGRGRGDVRAGSSARSSRASSTRSASPARAPSARRSASSAGATCRARASSSAARTRSW